MPKLKHTTPTHTPTPTQGTWRRKGKGGKGGKGRGGKEEEAKRKEALAKAAEQRRRTQVCRGVWVGWVYMCFGAG